MARKMVQRGSSGIEVKTLQQKLNNSGYDLAEDGIFGDKTLYAVKDYQKKNGLSVDGIVGEKTWLSLDGGATTTPPATTAPTAPTAPAPTASTPTAAPTPVAAPTIKPAPTAPTYDTTKYGDTEAGQNAWNAYQDAQNAVNNHGPFQYANQAQLDEIMNSILNREDFSYDFNQDAFYHQYKDKFTKQGKMAMQDTMGQAAAMTGGYGNSYAATAGNQAYQASLENLNDVIPELYQMAYDRYNQEGQDLYNQYGLLQSDYDRAYGEHNDEYNRRMDALGIARSDYYDGADLFHTEQNNRNTIAGREFDDAMNIWQNETNNAWRAAEFDNDNAWRAAEFNESNRRYENDFAYRQGRDQIADNQWQAQFDEGVRQYNEQFAYDKERDKIADSQWKAQFDENHLQNERAYSQSKKASQASGSTQADLNHVATMSSGELVNSLNEYSAAGDNQGLASFLDDCVATGRLTEAQADEYYAKYRKKDEPKGKVDTTVKATVPNTSGTGRGGRGLSAVNRVIK